MSGLLAPFEELARWGQRKLPARLRRVALLAPGAAVPRGARVRLTLPDAAVLWREVDVPQGAAADRQAAALAARVEEVSPWAAGAYHWAAAGAAAGGRQRVALVPAAPVQAMAEAARAAGGRLVEVTAGAPPLWLVEDGPGQAALARRLFGAWALTMALGLGVAVWSWQAAQDRALAADRADQRLARLLAEAGSGSATAQAARALAAGKTVGLADGLERLAAHLPLDSHVQTLRLEPGSFTIAGLSAAPEGIIPALSGAGGFRAVDFAGASMRDGESGLYSFAVTGQIGGAP